ncbi:unnamed protein product [Didymodactylos carnosus]|uniref:RING-type domain-containing protein n=1 Tax=Didymodactylos carnosus TaxID=1234261 RepID=A0A815FG33_9BILA|nr:unnamed protein product [Didymodactylos carnosus]CAF1328822.1 unnamed protein product [Didymodactylos carnosus]CAF3968868.1 unnamed protein product [Didymodactylos carnosus]CAF4180665.1 unnamed protein product [Didymodactylos carnosus]
MASNNQNSRLHSSGSNHCRNNTDRRYSDLFSGFSSSSRNGRFHQDTTSGRAHHQTRNMNDNSFRYPSSTAFPHPSYPWTIENNNSHSSTHQHRSNEQPLFSHDSLHRSSYPLPNRNDSNEQIRLMPNFGSNHCQSVNKFNNISQNDYHCSYSQHHNQSFHQQQKTNNNNSRQEYENDLFPIGEQSHQSTKRRRTSNQSRLQASTLSSSTPPLQHDHKRLRSIQENDAYVRQNYVQHQTRYVSLGIINEGINDLTFQHSNASSYRPFSNDSEEQYQRYYRQHLENSWMRSIQTQAHPQPQRPATSIYNDWHSPHDISTRAASYQNRSRPQIHSLQAQPQLTHEQHPHQHSEHHHPRRRSYHHHRHHHLSTRRHEDENQRRQMRGRLNFSNDLIRSIVPQLFNGHETLTDELMMELLAVTSPNDHYHILYPATVTIEISEIISYVVPEDVSVGLDKTMIDALPIVVYSKPSHCSGDENVDKCAVCLTIFDNGEHLKMLSCKHLYHGQCIDPWLQSNSSCPICRHDLREQMSD